MSKHFLQIKFFKIPKGGKIVLINAQLKAVQINSDSAITTLACYQSSPALSIKHSWFNWIQRLLLWSIITHSSGDMCCKQVHSHKSTNTTEKTLNDKINKYYSLEQAKEVLHVGKHCFQCCRAKWII